MLARRYTSGAFLLISLSCGELEVAWTSFPTSSGCSGTGGVGGGEGVEGGEGGEDLGVSEGVMGEDSDSEGEMVWDCNPLEVHWSNTSYSVMSKSCPAPWRKVGGRDEQHVHPVSGLLNGKPNTLCVIAVERHLIFSPVGIMKVHIVMHYHSADHRAEARQGVMISGNQFVAAQTSLTSQFLWSILCSSSEYLQNCVQFGCSTEFCG